MLCNDLFRHSHDSKINNRIKMICDNENNEKRTIYFCKTEENVFFEDDFVVIHNFLNNNGNYEFEYLSQVANKLFYYDKYEVKVLSMNSILKILKNIDNRTQIVFRDDFTEDLMKFGFNLDNSNIEIIFQILNIIIKKSFIINHKWFGFDYIKLLTTLDISQPTLSEHIYQSIKLILKRGERFEFNFAINFFETILYFLEHPNLSISTVIYFIKITNFFNDIYIEGLQKCSLTFRNLNQRIFKTYMKYFSTIEQNIEKMKIYYVIIKCSIMKDFKNIELCKNCFDLLHSTIFISLNSEKYYYAILNYFLMSINIWIKTELAANIIKIISYLSNQMKNYKFLEIYGDILDCLHENNIPFDFHLIFILIDLIDVSIKGCICLLIVYLMFDKMNDEEFLCCINQLFEKYDILDEMQQTFTNSGIVHIIDNIKQIYDSIMNW